MCLARCMAVHPGGRSDMGTQTWALKVTNGLFFVITTAVIGRPTVDLQHNKSTNTQKLSFMSLKAVYDLPEEQRAGYRIL